MPLNREVTKKELAIVSIADHTTAEAAAALDVTKEIYEIVVKVIDIRLRSEAAMFQEKFTFTKEE